MRKRPSGSIILQGHAMKHVDALRSTANQATAPGHKGKLGQFFTPMSVAHFMASMAECDGATVEVLDAGAGVGSLFTAVTAFLAQRQPRPKAIRVTAYEIDRGLCEQLREAVAICAAECKLAGVEFAVDVIQEDFLEAAAEIVQENLYSKSPVERFDLAILNPPYFKINTKSKTRQLIQQFGIGTSNIYAGFLAAATRLLKPQGEMIAITPRSFCNGTYFRPFRRWFLDIMRLRRIHSFHSRKEAFRDDDVLQETVIFRAVKGASRGRVLVSSSSGPNDLAASSRITDYDTIVHPADPQHFIRIPTDDLADGIADLMAKCSKTLSDLGLSVSTGRVVDFRVREHLRDKPGKGTEPLIWPAHFDNGYISWPKQDTRKPEAILANAAIADQLVPSEPYVLIRRFSAKEERRRIVAAVYDPHRVPCKAVGFENHLNYFHQRGRGLGMVLARGLTAFLNSTIVDEYFRQFSGHTQVNATDLRNMHYPAADQLKRIGAKISEAFPDQAGIDEIVTRELFGSDPIIETLRDRLRRKGTSLESHPF